jgi:hypothetical protein
MRPFFPLSLGLLAMMSMSKAQDRATYSQSYAILISGAVAGSETVTERTNDSGELVSTSEHEMFITDGLETKRMEFSTRMVLSKADQIPISYTYRYTTEGQGDYYDVEIKGDQITRTLNRGGHTSEVTVPLDPNMVILDFNVYHQYDYLVRKYDAKKGGRQVFADFMPVIGNNIPLAVTFLGNEDLKLKKGTLPVWNYSIEFVGIWGGSLSVDKGGRLVRLMIPAQDLQVVRKDLLDSDNSQN